MIDRLLIANRAEIAVRIARAGSDAGIATVALFAADEADSPHRFHADSAVPLPGRGPAAYLDIDALIAAAVESGCDAVHPGYGFLSENADFARRCAQAGLVFVGPSPETLALFGDKATARAFAAEQGVAVARGTGVDAGVDGARALLASLGDGRSIMLKAAAGGGGRGIRPVGAGDDLEQAWALCAAEARGAFGDDRVFAEEQIGRARHIEVQIVGDGTDAIHLYERECSLQRRRQKLVEIAPSPWLEDRVRQRLLEEAVALARASAYRGLGTVEFLVETDEEGRATGRHIFIELNPRLQVEHTVTEMVTGLDLVAIQIGIANGATLAALGLDAVAPPQGHAVQLRVNMERLWPDGAIAPSGGRIKAYDPPAGPGVRVDGFARVGYRTSPLYDALLAKLIVHAPSPDFGDVLRRARRAAREFRIDGVESSLPLLRALLDDPALAQGRIDTGYLERETVRLAAVAASLTPPDGDDAAAVDDGGPSPDDAIPAGLVGVFAPTPGQLVQIDVAPGDLVFAGQRLAVVEVMKMQTGIVAPAAGRIDRLFRQVGDGIDAGAALMALHPQNVAQPEGGTGAADADGWSDAGLRLLEEHRRVLTDDARPGAVALAARRGAKTARQRIATLCDAGSFVEIGGLTRVEGVGDKAPADGVIVGTARIDGRPVVLMSQDFSVFGGSVGHLGAAKVDRALELALLHAMPLLMLLDGGGHRIQDGQNSRDYAVGGDMFQQMTRLSGYAPIVSVALGAGFAANTNMAGFSDFVVMVRDRATLGIAGPALVKAGTGEVIDAQALGGAQVQVDQYGLADLAVDSEEEALDAARRFLSYLPGNAGLPPPCLARDPRDDGADHAAPLLRAVPTNTRLAYDVRPVIDHIADRNSLFEIKPGHAPNLVTGFARIAGRPVGFIANQALVLGGMLDAAACEKGAHFIGLCDAFGLPLIYLVDVPGFSIGSAAEKSNLGRKSARFLFELGNATVPRVSVILRKGYGLGYFAMAGGRTYRADGAFAWPDAEICAMSVEGSVDVAYRKLYEAAPDPAAKRQELIDGIRARISPIQAAEGFGIDDLIDPRETRARIIDVLDRAPARRDLHMPRKMRGIAPI
ncbi:MAG: carboxyl transferase domain-containing protein [Sphingobium sp.]